MTHHVGYYEVAGITIQVESDCPATDTTFDERFLPFRVTGPGPDLVRIRHHFGIPRPLPGTKGIHALREVHRKAPWVVYRGEDSWVYVGISSEEEDGSPFCVGVFSEDHSVGEIYNSEAYEELWRQGGLTSLTLPPTDQILLVRLLGNRQAVLFHSAAVAMDGAGLLFVGPAEAGKSTIVRMMKDRLGERVRVLSDDRNVVRLCPQGFLLYGTWVHSDVAEVCSGPVPLRAVFFLEQHVRNAIAPVGDRKEIWTGLVGRLVKGFTTAEWWQSQIDVLESLMTQVSCYTIRFDKSGEITRELERLVRGPIL